MGYTYTMGYHSALKRKAILTQATALDVPEDMLSEISQSQKNKDHLIPLM